MATLAEWTPLRAESIDTIRARIDAGVNAGLDPADPRWRDTVPGGFFYDHTQAGAFEAELLWDMASTELPASFFLPFSWGIYLDYWGELLSVPRKDAAPAHGQVTLTNGNAGPVFVATGTEVAAPANDPESDPLTFRTTQDATIAAAGNAVLNVEAVETGSEYNVAVAAVTLPLSSSLSGFTVTNVAAMSDGADVESDDAYKQRLLLEFSAARGGGTRDDYIAAALARPGIGHVVVEPRWAGNGTVRLILTTSANDPLSIPGVAAEQEFWDPPGQAGNGIGEAPINHVVTVATVTVVTVPIASTIKLESGFSFDGAGGTENITAAVTLAITRYFATLDPGEDVQRNRVMAAILEVVGVHDVTALTLNTFAVDKVIAALEVARPGVPALTAAP